jgi:hypothetical protein
MTMVVDFLWFGWWGGGFHLTNLLFHLIATALVFVFCRQVFSMGSISSLLATFFFAILGGHDYNLVTSTGRADILVALFTIAALLAENHSRDGNADILWKALALMMFIAALLSKEVGILIIPLVILLFELVPGSVTIAALIRGLRRIIPYIVVTGLFYLYHAHFTATDPLQSQPLQSEGATSLLAFFRNGAYGIAYTIAPMDLKTATLILSIYRIQAMLLTVFIVGLIGVLCMQVMRGTGLRSFYKPTIFTCVTFALVCLSFERWRLYTPSIGVVTLFALLLEQLWLRYKNLATRGGIVLVGLFFTLFQTWHCVESTANAIESTALMTTYKNELAALISPMPGDSLDITLLDLPAKLGGINVLQIGLEDIVQQGVAELRHLPGASQANVRNLRIINCNAAADIYSLDASRGFKDFSVTEISNHTYELEAPEESSTSFVPDEHYTHGISWRDRTLTPGDTIEEECASLLIKAAKGAVATRMHVRLKDTNSVAILFKDNMFEVVHSSNSR